MSTGPVDQDPCRWQKLLPSAKQPEHDAQQHLCSPGRGQLIENKGEEGGLQHQLRDVFAHNFVESDEQRPVAVRIVQVFGHAAAQPSQAQHATKIGQDRLSA